MYRIGRTLKKNLLLRSFTEEIKNNQKLEKQGKSLVLFQKGIYIAVVSSLRNNPVFGGFPEQCPIQNNFPCSQFFRQPFNKKGAQKKQQYYLKVLSLFHNSLPFRRIIAKHFLEIVSYFALLGALHQEYVRYSKIKSKTLILRFSINKAKNKFRLLPQYTFSLLFNFNGSQ